MSGLSSDAFARWVKTYRMIQSAGSKLLVDGYIVNLTKAFEAFWRKNGYFTSTGVEFGFGVDA